jgi:hypothetical protein
MASKKLSAREAIASVLGKADGPMAVPKIIEQAIPLTGLKGKTPGQTVYSILYAENKKPAGMFKRVGRGSFVLREQTATKDEPKAPADPKATVKLERAKKDEVESSIDADLARGTARVKAKADPKPSAKAKAGAASS